MNDIFSALAEPNRLRIVEFLCSGAHPVGAISTALNLNQPQASKHLAMLRSARLVNVEKRAQQRLYTIRPEALREMSIWLERYRSIWDARFGALDKVIEELQRKEKPDGRTS